MVGSLAGMFAVGPTSVSSFYGSIVKQRISTNGNAYLVDSTGLVIYHSEIERIGTNLIAEAVVRQAVSGEAGAVRGKDLDGQDVVASFAPVPGTSWGLVAEQPWDAVLAPGRRYGELLLVLLGLGVLIPAAVVTVSVRRITEPVRQLMAATKDVAGGNFGHQISVQTGDELQELAVQFNHMSTELAESYQALRSREERLASMTAGTNDGFWDWDLRSGDVYFSPRWKSMVGYADDEVPNDFDAWRGLIHPDDTERVQAYLQTYLERADSGLRSGVPHALQGRILSLDPGARRGRCVMRTARPLRMAGSHTDITERRLAGRANPAAERVSGCLARDCAGCHRSPGRDRTCWRRSSPEPWSWLAPPTDGCIWLIQRPGGLRVTVATGLFQQVSGIEPGAR